MNEQKINLDDLDPSIQFIFIAMLKGAMFFKEIEKDEEYYLTFAKAVWKTIEINGVDHINKVIEKKMTSDIEQYLKKYEESQKE